MTPYTPQDIQTFGAGIIALAIVFGAFIYTILKLAPILGKINMQLEIGNKKEDSTNKLVVAVDTLISVETMRQAEYKELKRELIEEVQKSFTALENHDNNAQEIREIEARIEQKLDGLTSKLYLLLRESMEG